MGGKLLANGKLLIDDGLLVDGKLKFSVGKHLVDTKHLALKYQQI